MAEHVSCTALCVVLSVTVVCCPGHSGAAGANVGGDAAAAVHGGENSRRHAWIRRGHQKVMCL